MVYVIQVCWQLASWSCSQAVWHIPLLCVQWKTPDDGQRNCPKHVEFYSKNKFEKLVHLVGFIIRFSRILCNDTRHRHIRISENDVCLVTLNHTKWLMTMDLLLKVLKHLQQSPCFSVLQTVIWERYMYLAVDCRFRCILCLKNVLWLLLSVLPSFCVVVKI